MYLTKAQQAQVKSALAQRGVDLAVCPLCNGGPLEPVETVHELHWFTRAATPRVASKTLFVLVTCSRCGYTVHFAASSLPFLKAE